MIGEPSFLSQLAGYLFVILLPVLALYIVYLIITKAFRDMGFSSLEAIVIVFVSFLLGAGIIDGYVGVSFSNIPLFTYHEYWMVGINVGGAVIPVLLSIYLSLKNRLKPIRVFLGIGIVTLVTYLVTYPDPEKGIVATFPLWILPIVIASLVSLLVYWKEKRKAAPLAYVIGTLGVLIGADCFHLISLLENEIHTTRNAVIGGANVFDMVFITGILAVFLDGLLIFQQKRKKGKEE
ncbi:MAG: DUF1614 domain-containing protein [Thermoplasmata archaeon]|nr:DUF1614 domain-containing protein [Thermoplasmata archaeon]MBE3139556.1 DUF1614 domain-containing protein [Thermoplasmata archaeon]